jgi:TRAP-type C4-dicarboxylate transport system permease small subunit
MQILLRNVFSIGITWGDGFIRLTVLWLALLGAMAASRDRKHLAIDVVGRFVSPRFRMVTATGTDLFTALVAGLLARYSWAFVRDSREFGDLLLNGLPAWTFQLILPVGFALVSYRYVLRSVQRLRGAG